MNLEELGVEAQSPFMSEGEVNEAKQTLLTWSVRAAKMFSWAEGLKEFEQLTMDTPAPELLAMVERLEISRSVWGSDEEYGEIFMSAHDAFAYYCRGFYAKPNFPSTLSELERKERERAFYTESVQSQCLFSGLVRYLQFMTRLHLSMELIDGRIGYPALMIGQSFVVYGATFVEFDYARLQSNQHAQLLLSRMRATALHLDGVVEKSNRLALSDEPVRAQA